MELRPRCAPTNALLLIPVGAGTDIPVELCLCTCPGLPAARAASAVLQSSLVSGSTSWEGNSLGCHRAMPCHHACHRACVTIPVSPCPCCRARVTMPVSPCLCYHAHVTMPVSPSPCHHACVTMPVLPCHAAGRGCLVLAGDCPRGMTQPRPAVPSLPDLPYPQEGPRAGKCRLRS